MPTEVLSCNFCEMQFTSRKGLKLHEGCQYKSHCTFCNKKLQTQEDLQNHEAAAHLQNDEVVVSLTGTDVTLTNILLGIHDKHLKKKFYEDDGSIKAWDPNQNKSKKKTNKKNKDKDWN